MTKFELDGSHSFINLCLVLDHWDLISLSPQIWHEVISILGALCLENLKLETYFIF